MRIAVLGVGLIGGSVGLAARERLGAEVVGWDPRRPRCEDGARARGARPRRARRRRGARRRRRRVRGRAGRRAAGRGARRRSAAAGHDCVVTDVGSTKRAVVEADRRPRASSAATRSPGAATAGVEHARADLFDGATWYLTPTARHAGTLYERLHRLLGGLGARPAAIDAATHDRLLATVSHLPHVLANVLVAQAAQALGEESVPATGPSFRDITRVAGSNTAIWRDIYLANADALIARDRRRHRPPRRGPRRARRRRRRRGRGLERRRARRPPPPARGRPRRRRGPRAARLGAQPPRRRGRGRARARPRRREHLRHGPLPGRPTARRATSSCGSPAPSARPRPRRWSPSWASPSPAHEPDASDPAPPCAGTLTPPPDKSLSHRAALLGAMSSVPVHVTNYLQAADTQSTLDAVAALGADVRHGARRGDFVIHGPGLRGARPGAAIDVGNAGTLLRLLPGWLAGQPEGGSWTLDGDESIRRRPVDRVARPLAAMGARLDARDGRFTPLTIIVAAAARDRVRAAGRLGADQVVRAARGAAGRRARRRWSSPSRAATTRSGCSRPPAPACAARATGSRSRSRDELRARRAPRPRRPVVGRLPRRGGGARARLGAADRGDGGQLDPDRLLPHPRAHGRAAARRGARDARDGGPPTRSRSRESRSRTARSAARA